MTDETVARMQARGITGMMPAYPRLLGNLDTEGTRLGALARKMGVTRQAVAQLAQEVERAGFVTRKPDPEDGRGVIVAFTAEGRRALSVAIETIAAIEADFAAVIGDDALVRLKADMAAILAARDARGGFGLD
ncbi:MAG: MarR family transcriptional regulator [Rhodobacteraceae bacterium]|nr:MarR family transcriptional regulator [Paracoccaceae bacterium]